MEGNKDIWATAVALALLDVARSEKRPFALLCFDAHIKHESIVMPGEMLPEAPLFVPADGGTNIECVVRRGLDIIEQHTGALRKADIVLITDGASDSENAPQLRARARCMGVEILGCGIDVEEHALRPWCDVVETHIDLANLEDSTAAELFGR